MTASPADAKSIFLHAAELATDAERVAFLDEACAGHPELRARVASLLKTALAPDSLLDEPLEHLGETRAEAFGQAAVSLDFLEACDTPGRLGRLGGYEVLDIIGRGGMGVVLRAMDAKLNRIVAIKVLAPELAGQPLARKRFAREAQAAAAVSHDHVVTIHAVEEGKQGDNCVPFLVMECVVGQSLQQKIDRVGALSLREILRIGMQIASGLSAAHKQGLAHRDIKPANILLENGIERVKITDFGLARATNDVGITQTGQISGTPQYMSPEQAMGQPIDQRSDLFSLGSVLYTMCTGRPAFRADSAVAVLRRVCDDMPRPIDQSNAEIPGWLIAIVDRLMAKDPADRYQTAEEVASVLEQCLAHVQQPESVACPVVPAIQTQADPAGAPGSTSASHNVIARAWREWWGERNRWGALAVSVVLLLVHILCMISFVAFGLSTNSDSEGHATYSYHLGVPGPWYKFETYPQPNTPFRFAFYPFSSSVLMGLAGCVVYYAFWRIERVRDPKTSKWNHPGFMLGFWGVLALIGVGFGHWQGLATVSKPRKVVTSPQPDGQKPGTRAPPQTKP